MSQGWSGLEQEAIGNDVIIIGTVSSLGYGKEQMHNSDK